MEDNRVQDIINNVIDTDTNPKEIIEDENKRPFFSVVVSCYNSNHDRIRELLNSVVNAGCPDITEVVIADDRSTDKEYLEVVKEFEDKFLKVTLTDVPDETDDGTKLIHCPGNTKETGARVASGEWITFIDHDDLFTDNAFKDVYNAINEDKEQYMVNTNFVELDPINKEIIKEMNHTYNWMHGKFYNLDNFWKAFDFHFPTNLQSHEDIAISSKTHCEIYRLKKDSNYWIDTFTYVWRAWPDSTSRIHYVNNNQDDRTYLEFYFYDYIASTLGVYNKDFDNLVVNNQLTEEDIDFHVKMYADVILYMYFYIQAFKFTRGLDSNVEYEYVVKQHIRNFYAKFKVDPGFLYRLVTDNNAMWYNAVRVSATNATGGFVEVDTFIDFISK